ncbi:MAG: hypothetical protein ACI8XO_003947 [Verrucomicrobiales bacterium]|jgi:hypothetical protein
MPFEKRNFDLQSKSEESGLAQAWVRKKYEPQITQICLRSEREALQRKLLELYYKFRHESEAESRAARKM